MTLSNIDLLVRCSRTFSPASGTPYTIMEYFSSRARWYSCTSSPSHLSFVFTNLCPSRLQVAHILLPLNIIVIIPSLPLQCQLHVYFLVVFRSTSVVLIPAPMHPQNFKNTPCSVSYLIMNLSLSKFPKGGTTRCVSLPCLYDHG